MNYPKLKQLIEETLAGRRDDLFAGVLNSIHCMSTPRVYSIINAVVSAMDSDELYVEVGTYQGGSLISALLGNDARAIGVDSFGEFKETNSLERTVDNLIRFGVEARVGMRNMGFAEFFAQLDPGTKIGAYYYDGAHDYSTQLAGMEAAWPWMRPGSIILVDDYTYPEVSQAVNQFVANHVGQVKFQFVILPTENTDPIWWNGCVVIKVM